MCFAKSSVRGVVTVSEVTAGKKSSLFFEIYGSEDALAWNEERANEILLKDPALLEENTAQYARYPGGHGEGFPDSHTQCNREIYEYKRDEKYREGTTPSFPTFKDGHRQDVLCDAIHESARKGEWIKVGKIA